MEKKKFFFVCNSLLFGYTREMYRDWINYSFNQTNQEIEEENYRRKKIGVINRKSYDIVKKRE